MKMVITIQQCTSMNFSHFVELQIKGPNLLRK